MTEVTEAYLSEVEAREAAATAGPFDAKYPHGDDFRAVRIFTGTTYIASVCNSDMDEDDIKSNAEFFAHARTDVPTLLAEVRRLRSQLKTVRNYIELRDEAPMVAGELYREVLKELGYANDE